MSNVKVIDNLHHLDLGDEDVKVYDNVKLSNEVQEQLTQRGYDVLIIHNEGLGVPAEVEDGDERDWNKVNESKTKRDRDRDYSRDLAKYNSFIKRALRLYRMYVFGSDFDITLKPFYLDDVDEEKKKDKDNKVVKQANRAWNKFLEHNKKWWTPDEFGWRVWRDGEQFTRQYKPNNWPVEVRFIDPEEIDDPKHSEEDDPKSLGIQTDPKDVNTVISYTRIDTDTQEIEATYNADEVWHTKIDCDSTEKRGVTRFLPVISWMRKLEALVSNEVTHRTLQSSIVLVRKVAGGTSAATGILNNAKTSTTQYPEKTLNREKIRPGSIITITNGTELEFASPNNTFSDASPLVKVLIVFLSAATGWSYSMLTTDASDGSFASSLTNESPVLQMVLDERKFFKGELIPIFKWVIEKAIESKEIEGLTKDDVWKNFDPEFLYGDIVSRDPLKDAQSANIASMAGFISKAEGARRVNADPDKMRREIEEEMENDVMNMVGITSSMNPGQQDKQQSSDSNAKDGQGTNQGDNEPIQHKDKLNV